MAMTPSDKAPCEVCGHMTTLRCVRCGRVLCAPHAAWSRVTERHSIGLSCPPRGGHDISAQVERVHDPADGQPLPPVDESSYGPDSVPLDDSALSTGKSGHAASPHCACGVGATGAPFIDPTCAAAAVRSALSSLVANMLGVTLPTSESE